MQRTFGPKTSDVDTTSKIADLAKREGVLEERERTIAQKQKLLDEKIDHIDKLKKKLEPILEKTATFSKDDAKKLLLEQTEKDLGVEMSKMIKEAEDQAKLTADEKVREILLEAMQHGFVDYVSEFTTSKVELADDEMKGRIIGKEGRNARTFEQAAGVDLLIDETPGVLVISSFDPIRREIAKVSMERLMKDGRIQPQRIEEIVEKTREDIEKIMMQAGEKLCHDAGVYNLPVELVALLGRFKYRYSFGQNLIVHTLEEVKISVALAKMLDADPNIVRLGCLLHDIGKIISEDEGTHVEKGVQVLKKFNIPQNIIDCVAEHHNDQHSSQESVIVAIADAISGGRPGARHENVGDYIKRLDDIEKIATSFDGVERAFAVQAGREVRVIVSSDQISDEEMPKLTHDIAQRISKEVMVPGAVKVTAIRETRVTEYTTTMHQVG